MQQSSSSASTSSCRLARRRELSASTFLEYPSPLQLAQHLHERYSTGGVQLADAALALANAKSGLLSSDTLIEAASCEGAYLARPTPPSRRPKSYRARPT